MNKKISAVLASAAAVAFVSLTPIAAQAEPVPDDCHHGIGWQPNTTWASCNKGSGYVQAIAKCSNGSTTKTVKGRWVTVPSEQSVAVCPSTHKKAVGHSF